MRTFFTYTLPEDHSASEVNIENTLGSILKLTRHYPASDAGNRQDIVSSKLWENVC